MESHRVWMTRFLIASTILIARPDLADAQEYRAEIALGSGGATSVVGKDGCPAHLWIPLVSNPSQQPPPAFTIIMRFTEDGAPVVGATVTKDNTSLGYNAIPYYGGHHHAPPQEGYGTYALTGSSETDHTGAVSFTFTPSSNASGLIFPSFRFQYGAIDWSDFTCNAIVFSMDEDTMPPLNSSSDYSLVGMTTWHLDNHFGRSWFLSAIAGIAWTYKDHYSGDGLKLALNDLSLQWGGNFDLDRSFAGSHYYHHLGEHVDVRANGAADSIPETASVRLYFRNLVYDVLGYYPHLEGDGTSNEHYHVCGNSIGPCGGLVP